jgi:large exoprotein involved in heme utilization and adhesion
VTITTTVLTMQEGGEINVSAFSTGRAGDIVVNVGQLTLMGGAFISSNTLGAGHGGAVTITARETVTISGQSNDGHRSSIEVDSLAPEAGDAGRLSMTASTLASTGAIDANTTGAGRAGDIVVTVGKLSLRGGGIIASSTSGTGAGGDVTVVATDSIVIAGSQSTAIAGSQSNVSSFAGNRGDAGRLAIVAPLVVLDGGSIVATSVGAGRAGDIMVEAGQLTLRGGAFITSATGGAGAGGAVTITAREAMTISGQSSNVNSFASKVRNGRLSITAPSLALDGGAIATTPLVRAVPGYCGGVDS